MKRVCAWCERDLGSGDPPDDSDTPITHGICSACAGNVLSGLAEPLRDFLDRLGVPVLLVESEPKVLTANRHAREMLGKETHEIDGHRGGDVIECAYAKAPAGCGSDAHCKSCTIRNTVLETFATGKSFVGVRAYPDVQTLEGTKTMLFEISTEKVGGLVILRMDDVGEAQAQPDAPADAR